DLPSSLPLRVEAYDLPWSGLGTRRLPLRSALEAEAAVRENTDWFLQTALRAKKKGLPVIVVTRSASALLPLMVHERAPGLIDGVVLISPTHPSIEEQSRLSALEVMRRYGIAPNVQAFEWARAL